MMSSTHPAFYASKIHFTKRFPDVVPPPNDVIFTRESVIVHISDVQNVLMEELNQKHNCKYV